LVSIVKYKVVRTSSYTLTHLGKTSGHALRLLTTYTSYIDPIIYILPQTNQIVMSLSIFRLTRRDSSASMASDSTELTDWSYDEQRETPEVQAPRRRMVRSASEPTMRRVIDEAGVCKKCIVLKEKKAERLWRDFWC
jgi:hypothetical protein